MGSRAGARVLQHAEKTGESRVSVIGSSGHRVIGSSDKRGNKTDTAIADKADLKTSLSTTTEVQSSPLLINDSDAIKGSVILQACNAHNQNSALSFPPITSTGALAKRSGALSITCMSRTGAPKWWPSTMVRAMIRRRLSVNLGRAILRSVW